MRSQLETLVAAYCPLPEEVAAQPRAAMWWCCGVANMALCNKGYRFLIRSCPTMPAWVWWNGAHR